MNLHPDITELAVAEIAVETRLRPFSEAEVEALVGLIAEFGQTTPILVRRKRSGFVLVDGLHRLEATKRAGLSTIPVRVYTMTDEDARLLETSQNLVGGLSPLDDAVFLASWKKEHLRKHPETKRGVAGALARHGLQANSSSFADLVAMKRAVSVRQVQRIIAAGEQLGHDDLASLRNARGPVTLKDLEALGKIDDPEERSWVVRKLALGAAKSVSEARRQIAAEAGGEKAEAAPRDPVEDGFNALVKAWQRAPTAAKKRFLLEYRSEVWEAQNKGAPLHKWAEAAE